jgi:hypothetical protein
VRRFISSLTAIAALAVATAVLAARNAATTTRLVSVTSPVKHNATAKLVARVRPAHRCTTTVRYKIGPAHARGLKPKYPVHGRVSWTWIVGGNTTLGTWPIRVNCGSAGSFLTHFKVVR